MRFCRDFRGTLFSSNALVLSVASYYDASQSQKTSHLRRDLGSGQVTAYTLAPVGHTAGYMTLATGALAPALTGNFGLPIVTRESFGRMGARRRRWDGGGPGWCSPR